MSLTFLDTLWKWEVASYELEINTLSFVPSSTGTNKSDTDTNFSAISPIRVTAALSSSSGLLVSTTVETMATHMPAGQTLCAADTMQMKMSFLRLIWFIGRMSCADSASSVPGTGWLSRQIIRTTCPTLVTLAGAYEGSQITALHLTVSSPERTPLTLPSSPYTISSIGLSSI
eukprot:Lithocolla_globosa_v1_NODE_3985_length_1531_cov_248.524646.p2 type:complete len:173 gc:universal NODE_3985_length_1531_cov_248.524646:183-701(+)